MTTAAILQPLTGTGSNCPSQKKVFLSETEAIVWEQQNRAKYNTPKQYAYKCEDCPKWHLTSKMPGSVGIASASSSLGRAALMAPPFRKGRGRPSAAEIQDRRAKVAHLHSEGKAYAEIARSLGWNEQTIANDLHVIKHGSTLKVTKPTSKPLTLDLIASQKQALEAQLKVLAAEEQRLIEAKALKTMLCWDGKGILIQKEGNRLALSLEDCVRLVGKLGDLLKQ
jgi:hypothetical protein